MQNNPASLGQLERIEQLLSQTPQMGQGVRSMAHSIASYDGDSAIRYVEMAISTRHLSVFAKEKTARCHAIAC